MNKLILFSLLAFEIISPPKLRLRCKDFLCLRSYTDDTKTKNDEDIEEPQEPFKYESSMRDTRNELEKVAIETEHLMPKLEVSEDHRTEKRIPNLKKLQHDDFKTLKEFLNNLESKLSLFEKNINKKNMKHYLETIEDFSQKIERFLEYTMEVLIKDKRDNTKNYFVNSCLKLQTIIKYIIDTMIGEKNDENSDTVEQYVNQLKIVLDNINRTYEKIIKLFAYHRHTTNYEELTDEELDELIKKVEAKPRVANDYFVISVNDPNKLLEEFVRQNTDDSTARLKNIVNAYVKFQNVKSDEREEKYEKEIIIVYNKLGDMLLQYFEKSKIKYFHIMMPSICKKIENASDRESCFNLMLILANNGIQDIATVLKELMISA